MRLLIYVQFEWFAQNSKTTSLSFTAEDTDEDEDEDENEEEDD
jgi:hypothetical protein